jgi:LmbE family N-acetylglucosaminyl deacetylase
VATCGGKNDPTSGIARIEESEKAFGLIQGAKVIARPNRRGLIVEDYSNNVWDLEKIIDEVNPDLILVPSHQDTHQDHRMMHDITMTAIRRRKISILFYATLSSDFKANLFVDIGDYLELKKVALKCHVSQQGKNWMTDEYLESFNSDIHAKLIGIKYSERFETGRLFL